MHEVVKEEAGQKEALALSGAGWELLLPAMDENVTVELEQTRATLLQAEMVIRAQEERIRQLQQMALTDELTGLYNRRGFETTFEREMALARRDANHSGILVMVDLDGFKQINDRWGHQTGDAYLCAVAKALLDGVRTTDTVARLGGDEFAILMPGFDEKSGLRRLARLEQGFAKKALRSHERLPLRASFGLAAYNGGDQAQAVMQAADLRLYGHKSRNRKFIVNG